MKLSRSERSSILAGLVAIGQLGAKAEALDADDLLRATLPIRSHLRALEPDILLIVGGRGAGKSHLFRVVNAPNGPEALGLSGEAPRRDIWIRGFSAAPTHAAPYQLPSETVLERFAAGRSRADLVDFWRGLLAGALLNCTDSVSALLRTRLPQPITGALHDLSQISEWHPAVIQSLEAVDTALNKLDTELAAQGRYLFVTYDDLDVMAVEWDQKRLLIQALLQFWLGQWRRWQRIRPKIFLRRDLLSADFLQFPDASKLEGNRLDLKWSPMQLYQLVFKLWANQNEASRLYNTQELGLRFIETRWLGWLYENPWPADDLLREAVSHIMGPFMGSGSRKGRTFEWVPNHLQDANGEIVPRSMINIFALAGEDEVTNQRATDVLLSYLSFGAAIEQVSIRRIKELEEAYPWLAAIRPSLQGQQVPVTREQMIDVLQQVDWKQVDRPPISRDPGHLLAEMLQTGILRLTTDRRFHVPDIYLYGFGLKRKGGIRRPSKAATT